MIARSSKWQLQEAKNKLSEVIRRAREEGPQTITQHGEVAAILVSPKRYEELGGDLPDETSSGESLADFFLRWSAIVGDIEFEISPRQADEPRPNPFADET